MEDVERRESMIGHTKIHFVPTFTKGINYVAYYFKLDCLTEDELFYADILSDIIGRVDTSKRSYEDLAKLINLNLGGLSADITGISKAGHEMNSYRSWLYVVRCCMLNYLNCATS